LESGLPRFRPGFTCPALLRYQSGRFVVSPTGLSPCTAALSRTFDYNSAYLCDRPYNPESTLPVWALPSSLAATLGISFDFFSSAYLDVSVQQVRFDTLWIQVSMIEHYLYRVPPFGHPRISTSSGSPRLFAGSTSFFACQCQGIHQQPLVA
jgi:hypothetical protein